MSVNITTVFENGVKRMRERNGRILIGLQFVLLVIPGITTELFPPQDVTGFEALIVLGVILFSIVAVLVVQIVAVRVFVNGETERFPRELVTRRIGWAVLNSVIGGLVFLIAVCIGLVALVIPGLFLLTTLPFWYVHMIIEDENFITSFRKSWELTSGHRLRLFALGAFVLLFGSAFNVGPEIAGGVIGPIVTVFITSLGSALSTMFLLATLAGTYNRLIALSRKNNAPPTDDREEVGLSDDTSGSI